MNAERRQALIPPALRLAAFAALAALAAAQWMRLLEAPPVGKVVLAVGLLILGAAALALIAVRQPGRAASWALGALAALVATAAGLVAIGVPIRLLEPRGWGELLDNISTGFSGLAGDVEYPYHRDNEWSRLVILAGLPLALGIAAALAFWPFRGAQRARRIAPLVVLAAVFGMAATVIPPAAPLLWGFLLLLGIGAWLWLPSLSRRDAIAATALVASAGAIAIPVAGWLDHEEPWIDFREWEFGRETPTSFNWDHSYGPLDWPREGTTLFAAESAEAQYWKAAVLDRFDGARWVRPELIAGVELETPIQVEGARATADEGALNENWIEGIDFTVGPLESEFVLTAGALGKVTGDLTNVLLGKDGTAVNDGGPLEDGDTYSVQAYVPDPSPERMRAAPERYPEALSRYTEFATRRQPSTSAEFTAAEPVGNVEVPLRGSDDGGDPAASRAIAASPYARTYNLARSLTASAPTNYDAVLAIQEHLQSGFAYNEDPPKHRYPLAGFLFEDQFGYCQQFSGAMALMLRMAGIPSRVVSGFSPGTPDPDEKNRYLVEDLDAHSWVEVYFPSIGWVTFDPTPAGAPTTGRTPEAVGQIPQTELNLEQQQGIDKPRKGFAPPGKNRAGREVAESGLIPLWSVPAGIGIVGMLGLTALAGFTVVRRHRYQSLSPAAAADAHLRELPPALARLGWPIKTHETLLALERRLRNYRKLAAARYVAKLRAGRFSHTSDGTPTLAERRALRTELVGRNGLRSRLRGLFALPPGGPTRRV